MSLKSKFRKYTSADNLTESELEQLVSDTKVNAFRDQRFVAKLVLRIVLLSLLILLGQLVFMFFVTGVMGLKLIYGIVVIPISIFILLIYGKKTYETIIIQQAVKSIRVSGRRK
jgi:hypothetical protein